MYVDSTMDVFYYLTVFPIESLIASQLPPDRFGPYMATGSKKSTADKIIYINIEPFETDTFDWEHAKKRCRPHRNGSPKHSVYLAVYRVLEQIPLSSLHTLFLTTPDGRILPMEQEEYLDTQKQEYYIYKELCPVSPLVLSELNPKEFPRSIIHPESKTWIPKMAYADLSFDLFFHTDESCVCGSFYSRGPDHIQICIDEIRAKENKHNKILARLYTEPFSYQLIDRGIFISDGRELVFYRMKNESELREHHRDWARSAMII